MTCPGHYQHERHCQKLKSVYPFSPPDGWNTTVLFTFGIIPSCQAMQFMSLPCLSGNYRHPRWGYPGVGSGGYRITTSLVPVKNGLSLFPACRLAPCHGAPGLRIGFSNVRFTDNCLCGNLPSRNQDRFMVASRISATLGLTWLYLSARKSTVTR